MKVSGEQVDIIMTALQDYRSNLYLDGNHSAAVKKVSDIILAIENEQPSKDVGQKKIPLPLYEAELESQVGSETGIELDENYNDNE